MFLFRPYLILFLCLAASIQANQESIETWTRAEDQKAIKASLVSFDLEADQLTLELKSGKEYTIKPSTLIEADQARLKSLHETMEAKKAEAAKPRMKTYRLEGGGGHKIHVYKPIGYIDDSPESKKTPIAIVYSPGGNSKQIVDRMKKVSNELGWVIVGVDAYKNDDATKASFERRLRETQFAFNWVKRNVSFDPQKIVFGGFSGGGWWSFVSASEITQEAAGILSFGGWMAKMYDKKYSKKMAVAIVNGDQDTNAKAWEKKDRLVLEKESRATVKVIHFPGKHVLAPEDVALDAARWIHETKKFNDEK